MTVEIVPTWTKGDVLRKAREGAGFTQRELAERLEVDVNTVRRVEAGLAPVKRSRIYAWAMATGVKRVWLEWSLDSVEQGWAPWGTGEDVDRHVADGRVDTAAPRQDMPGGANVRHQGLEPRTRWFEASELLLQVAA